MQALRQLKYAQPLEVCQVPIPTAEPGQAIVQILAANILSYQGNIYNGKRKYPYPTPLTAGTSAVGRIHDLGPDSTSLQKGSLVFIDCTYRSRDDPTHVFLTAIHEGYTPGSQKLMSHWRDGTYAEYASIPLENCYPLNDNILLKSSDQGGQGYTLPDFLSFPMYLVPYGGLSTIDLRPSETIIIAPATGAFGTVAVHLALSLGARVIAMGRNTTSLQNLSTTISPLFPPNRLFTVPLTNDLTKDTAALKDAAHPFPIDAYLDISPPEAAGSNHIKAAIMSLRHSARFVLMGGIKEDVGIPHSFFMHWNLTMKGKWMFERDDVRNLIRMIEMGTLKLGRPGGISTERFKGFGLEEWEAAFEWAEGNVGLGEGAYFKIAE